MKSKALLIIILVGLSSFAASYTITILSISHVRTTTISVSVGEATQDRYLESAKKLLNEVVDWVEGFRGLKLKKEVEIRVLTKEWVIEHWGKGFINLTEVRLEEVLLKYLLIIPEDFNLTEYKIGVSGYTIAASADHTIYLVREFFDPRDELRAGAILAHELTHILQGEYFRIPGPATMDERNALNALIEGDANLVSSTYLAEHGGESKPLAESRLNPLDALWLFPYIYGESFVRYVYEHRGWDGVNALYRDPPRSTSQILHPEKYLGGWKPISLDPPKTPSSCSLRLRDTLGEFFIRQMIRAHLDPSTANRSAEGWLGDVVQICEKDDIYILQWKIAWESEEDMWEFLQAFRQILRDLDAEELGGGLWILGDRQIRIEELSENTLLLTISPVSAG